MDKDSCSCKNIKIVQGTFGQVVSDDGEETPVKSYKMCNNYGTEVILISWGATIISIKCVDKYGKPADIVLGFDNIDSYLDLRLSKLLGGIGASFDAQQPAGRFGHRLWESCIEDDCRVVMSYLSPDGEEGRPGALLVTIKFELTRYNSLEISMRAVSSKSTTLDLWHSCVFNLAGHASGSDELRDHEISLNCDRWLDDDAEVIRPVGGSHMDLRMPQSMNQVIDKVSSDDSAPPTRPYFVITRGASLLPKLSFVSRISHPKSGRFLEVYSDQPGVDFCTGSHLPPQPVPMTSDEDEEDKNDNNTSSNSNSSKDCLNPDNCDCKTLEGSSSDSGQTFEALEFLDGKCGAKYKRFGGLSLLPRNRSIPAAKSLFPSATLRPGQVYYHDLLYKFGLELDSYCVSR